MILIKFKKKFQKSCKTKKKIPQIKSNQVIISYYQEEYKRLMCKIIRNGVFIEKNV